MSNLHPIRLAYQPPASSTFISEQTSHQQPASSSFFSKQISTSRQPPANKHAARLGFFHLSFIIELLAMSSNCL
jgi:hypothetical protein